MEKDELMVEISALIDKYFSNPTQNVIRESDSIWIELAVRKRLGGIFFESNLLARILFEKGFKKELKEHQFCYNISKRDVKILFESKAILDKLKHGKINSFRDYLKLPGFKNVNDYKYTFKYWIRIKLGNEYSENMVYRILACETEMDLEVFIDLIETFNIEGFSEMPLALHEKLLKIFDLSFDESITNKIMTFD